MDPTVVAALNKLLEAWGATGAIGIVCGIVIKSMYGRIQELHEKRLNEAREAAGQNLALIKEFNKSMDGLTQAVNNLRDVVIAAAKQQ